MVPETLSLQHPRHVCLHQAEVGQELVVQALQVHVLCPETQHDIVGGLHLVGVTIAQLGVNELVRLGSQLVALYFICQAVVGAGHRTGRVVRLAILLHQGVEVALTVFPRVLITCVVLPKCVNIASKQGGVFSRTKEALVEVCSSSGDETGCNATAIRAHVFLTVASCSGNIWVHFTVLLYLVVSERLCGFNFVFQVLFMVSGCMAATVKELSSGEIGFQGLTAATVFVLPVNLYLEALLFCTFENPLGTKAFSGLRSGLVLVFASLTKVS